MVNYGSTEMKYISDKHPVMEALVNHYGRLELGKTGDIYMSLVLHIISQMMANSVSNKLVQKFNDLVGDIIPENVVSVSVDDIRECGISRKKAEYIIDLSNSVLNEKYDFSLLYGMNDDAAINYLMQIKGVGKWTAEMIVEFTMGRLNIFSYEDVALQNGIKKAHGFKTLSKLRFERLRQKYSPYCSVASVYYYAHNDDQSGWKIESKINQM